MLVWHDCLNSVLRGHEDEGLLLSAMRILKRCFSCGIRKNTEPRENLSCLAVHYSASALSVH